MRLTNSKNILEFKFAVSKCIGDVWLQDGAGTRLNLKSFISQYIAIGELLQDRGEELELFCENKEDEANFMKFFNENPDVLS